MSIWLNPAYDIRSATRDLNFVIIGGGGWLGRATLDILYQLLGKEDFGRRVLVLGSQLRELQVAEGVSVMSQPLKDSDLHVLADSIVFYYSFLTKDKVKAGSTEGYIATNRAISDRVYALVARSKPRALVLPSSGAVYDRNGELERDIERNPYGALKVVDESRFGELMDRLDSRYAVPRIFGLSGEYINKHEAYALAGFINDAQAGRPIEIRARHDVFRSYMYIGDLIGLTLWLALGSEHQSVTFDTAGEEVVEIEDLAARVTRCLGVASVPILRSRDPSLARDWYVGNGALLEGLLRQAGAKQMPLDSQIRRTAEYLGSKSADVMVRPEAGR